MDIFLRYILPSLLGVIGAFVYNWSNLRGRKYDTRASVALQKSLMTERKQLVSEIRSLEKRCDGLEDQNRNQAEEILDLQQKNYELVNEIRNFGSHLK
jgi:phage shock protein A